MMLTPGATPCITALQMPTASSLTSKSVMKPMVRKGDWAVAAGRAATASSARRKANRDLRDQRPKRQSSTNAIESNHQGKPELLRGFLFDVASKFKAHGGKQLIGKISFTARTEALVERSSQHRRGHAFVNGRLNGPTTLAGIGDVAGELR